MTCRLHVWPRQRQSQTPRCHHLEVLRRRRVLRPYISMFLVFFFLLYYFFLQLDYVYNDEAPTTTTTMATTRCLTTTKTAAAAAVTGARDTTCLEPPGMFFSFKIIIFAVLMLFTCRLYVRPPLQHPTTTTGARLEPPVMFFLLTIVFC